MCLLYNSIGFDKEKKEGPGRDHSYLSSNLRKILRENEGRLRTMASEENQRCEDVKSECEEEGQASEGNVVFQI
jgi:hypothetical protein